MADVRVLSLGWGVQSFTLAAMSALGELDPLDAAIHADTRYERSATYAFAEHWTPWLEANGVPVRTVQSGELKANVTRQLPKGTWEVQIPAFTIDGKKKGQMRRQCTHQWKIRPFRNYVRQMGKTAEVWLGISTDEWKRARDADVRYITNRFPLLERGMTRRDCEAWLNEHDLPVPAKSSCTFCPYHTRQAFVELAAAGGRDWEMAVKTDAVIRDKRPPYALYVHPARRPLAEAVLAAAGPGVSAAFDPDGKCDEGVCWV